MVPAACNTCARVCLSIDMSTQYIRAFADCTPRDEDSRKTLAPSLAAVDLVAMHTLSVFHEACFPDYACLDHRRLHECCSRHTVAHVSGIPACPKADAWFLYQECRAAKSTYEHAETH